jgi:hypothetical protein
VEYGARQHVAALAAIELHQDAATVDFVVEVVEEAHGLDDATELGQGPGEPRRAVVGLKGADEAGGLHHAELEGAGETQEVVPMLGDELGVDAIAGQRIERAAIGLGIDPPQVGAAGVGEPRAELEAEQTEHAKDRIGVGAGIGHDLDRLQFRLLFEHDGEQYQLSRSVPGTTTPLRPAYWTEVML